MVAQQRDPAKAIVIGAGVGGLTTAALLARAGLEVTVLEAHIYPGGCAGTFFHQGYRSWNIAKLVTGELPPRLRSLPALPSAGWGAFVAYVGLDEVVLPAGLPLYHQVIVREPLGEGNSVFLSLSPVWDGSRAPHGQRALTISTHTLYIRRGNSSSMTAAAMNDARNSISTISSRPPNG